MAAVVEVSGLRKEYGRTVAVADVSFEVESDEIFGLLGPNGSGKTTTVECLQGLRRADAGRLRVTGDGRLVFIDDKGSELSRYEPRT